MMNLDELIQVTVLTDEISNAAERRGYLLSELRRYRYPSKNWELTDQEYSEASLTLLDTKLKLKNYIDTLK